MVVTYTRRVIDTELDELMPDLAAKALEGAKGVGKTATAERRAKIVMRMDDPDAAEIVRVGGQRVVESADKPLLIDKLQRLPEVWDRVRRAVDADTAGGQFLLTGSAASEAEVHSGAGRIISLRMRPLSIAERGIEEQTVSLNELLDGGRRPLAGSTGIGLSDYIREIVSSGFPGVRALPERARSAQLDSYLQRIVDRDLREEGLTVRRPQQLRRWLAAYAAATASTATWETISRAASPGEGGSIPSRASTLGYRDALSRLGLLDPLPSWTPAGNEFGRLGCADKHFLSDPALTVRLLDLDASRLVSGAAIGVLGPQDKTMLGRLFEALVVQSVLTYAQASGAMASHYRERSGKREIDVIVKRHDGAHLALEVKLANRVEDRDVKHLLWARQTLGPRLADAAIIYTGAIAYRRPDGVAVVPLSLLGP